jgi:hypothetical protein
MAPDDEAIHQAKFENLRNRSAAALVDWIEVEPCALPAYRRCGGPVVEGISDDPVVRNRRVVFPNG